MGRACEPRGVEGLRVYLVGGAVRDELLGLPVRECDWVVVGATPEAMLARGFLPADSRFPVFYHPETGEEYALARRETKTAPGYKGFSVHAGPEVTLEQDLARRDLTINAMARAPSGEIIDPFGGQRDLAARLLRHVTPAFVEDPVRLLRTARFAAVLGHLGFHVADATLALMRAMATAEELAALRPERLWRETKRALAGRQPWCFFELLHRCGALARLIPALAGRMEAGGEGPMAALRRAVALGAAPEARLAVTLAPAVAGVSEARTLARDLRLERPYAELLERLVAARPDCGALAGDAGALLGFMRRHRGLRGDAAFGQLLLACAALCPGLLPPPRLERVRRAVVAAARVRAADLGETGLRGPALGEALDRLRLARIEAVLAGQSP